MNIYRTKRNLYFALFFLAFNAELCTAQNSTKIDWLLGYVSATGRGYAKKTGGPMDVDNAIDAAKVVAQGELLEAIKGVMVDNQTAVSDLMTEKTETTVRVQGVLHNAMQSGEPVVKEVDGFVTATVEMRVCLYDKGTECKSDKSLISVLPKNSLARNNKNESCNLLPNITSSREVLSKVTYDANKPLAIVIVNLKGSPFDAGTKDFVIGFEADGGRKCSVYSPEKVDPVVRKDRGTAEIFLHTADAGRKYGANNIVLDAKSIGQGNYIVIDAKDAYLLNLLNEREKNAIFKEAKIGVAAQD